eukprot:s5657_g2.t1
MAPKVAKAKPKQVRAVRAAPAAPAPKAAIAKGVKGKGRAAPPAPAAPAAAAPVAPDERARLPFQALCLKLAGQMPVMQIRSLVSKGVIPPVLVFGPAAPAPVPLEELRQKTQETVTGALQQIQGWRDRAELMQCLNSVVPLERFAEAWRPIRDAALETCEAMTWPAADGHALVLLEFLGGGYGATVAAAWVMRKDDWDAYKAAVMAKPAESISNELLSLLNSALTYDRSVSSDVWCPCVHSICQDTWWKDIG